MVNPAGLSLLLLWTLLAANAQGSPALTLRRIEGTVAATEKLAQAEIEKGAAPGLAVAVVFQDKLVYAKGFGVKDTRTEGAVDADTVFQLASVSKPVGSTVAAATPSCAGLTAPTAAPSGQTSEL